MVPIFLQWVATAMWPSPLYIKPLPGSFMMPLTHWIPQATQEKRRECFWATRWRSRARNCSKLEEIIFCKCSKCAWEGAFLVITCSLVKQGSDTLVWVLQCGLGGGVSTPRYHGKKSGCLVSLTFTFKQLNSFVCDLAFSCLLLD